MPTYVAFLRSINVTGRFLKMPALAAHFRTLGFDEVQTYINSGNVIFTSAKRLTKSSSLSIEVNLERLLGFKSEVFLRTAAEVSDIAAFASSLRDEMPAKGSVNVSFLPDAPSADATQAMLAFRSDLDEFVVRDKELYWMCRTTVDRSKFSNAVLERRLGIRATLRREKMLRELSTALHDRLRAPNG